MHAKPLLAKPLLVLSSYAPLFAMLAIRLEDWTLRSVCIGLAVAGALILLGMVALVHRTEALPYKVKSVSAPGAEASAYLASYLLPFVIDGKPTGTDLAAYVLFLLVAGVVTARTGVIQVNPLLYLVGYRLVQITDETGYVLLTMARKQIRADDVLSLRRLPGDVALAG